MTPDELCGLGLTCARVRSEGRWTITELQPPSWDYSDVSQETFSHYVYLSWLGHDLILSGRHLGPRYGDYDWDHLTSNPYRHWMVRWLVDAEDDDSASRPLAEDELDLLPDRAAWDRVGEWLLGILMAARLSQSEVTSEELTQAIADNWGAFVAGFDE